MLCIHAAVTFVRPDYTTLKFPDMNAVGIDLMNVEDGCTQFQL